MGRRSAVDAAKRVGTDVQITVPNPVGDGKVTVATTIFLPESGSVPTHFLIALPGGGYTREYWHPSNLDSTYSFALAALGRGYGVVTLDTLGSGQSERVVNGDDLSLQAVAKATDSLVQVVRQRLGDGSLVTGLPPVGNASYIGLGHSMGGAIAIVQQGASATYDAIAILGYTNKGFATMDAPQEGDAALTPAEREAWAREHVPQQQWGKPWEALPMYLAFDRTHIRTWFHYSDVPEAVIAAEEARATELPRSMALQTIIPGVTARYAANVTCPVFLAFGEVDVSADPLGEATTYAAASDITVLRLPGAGHCHNYSTPRAHLWERLLSWGPTVV